MIPKSGNRFSDKIMRKQKIGDGTELIQSDLALGSALEAVMREAGELARHTSRGPFKRWTKGHDNSPVSDGDIAVNALLHARLGQLVPDIIAQPKVHSLALRLTRVAHGALDVAFASPGSHDWDLAAADLLVHEAGGVLTDLAGQQLCYNRPHVVHGALRS